MVEVLLEESFVGIDVIVVSIDDTGVSGDVVAIVIKIPDKELTGSIIFKG